jgi:hypothetical protein
MKIKILVTASAVALGSLVVAPAAWGAVDSLERSISNISPLHTELKEGGSDLLPGTYSSANNVVLSYVVTGYEFPTGVFGSFALGLRIADNSSVNPTGQTTNFTGGRTIGINQAAGGNSQITLARQPTSLAASGPGVLGSSAVTIEIDCSGGCPNEDGATMQRTLDFSDTGPDRGLASSINGMSVRVEITLVHPTDCLKIYNLLSDQDSTVWNVESTEVVVVKNGRNAGKVNATTPFGQFSDNVLVANTCSGPEVFDLRINLDNSFDTNPNGNPGNAVFTHVAGAAVDPDTFEIDDFYMVSAHGQSLCLSNVSLDEGESLLARVHMGIRRGMHMSDLTNFDHVDGPGPFAFSAELRAAGLSCEGTTLGSAGAEMTYSIK